MNTQKTPRVVPAILSDKIEDYVEQVEKFKKFSSKIHIDIMDGIFVAEKSPSAVDIMAALKDDGSTFSVHLMVSKPEEVIDSLAQFNNINIVYVHAEVAFDDMLIYKYPFNIALVINPDTDIAKYKNIISNVAVIQVMTVNPGKQGSAFISQGLNQIDAIRGLGFEGQIHVDGHIDEITILEILKFDPAVLNVGSAITKNADPKYAWSKIQSLCKPSEA